MIILVHEAGVTAFSARVALLGPYMRWATMGGGGVTLLYGLCGHVPLTGTVITCVATGYDLTNKIYQDPASDLTRTNRMIVLSPTKILFCSPRVWYTIGQGPLCPLYHKHGIFMGLSFNRFYNFFLVCPKL